MKKIKRIHILGASGSGTTTLAAHLSRDLAIPQFDSDDYFWQTKYSEIRPREERLGRLRDALISKDTWILSGAIIDWGNPLTPLFDLVVFLSIPNELRLKRLELRQKARYGDAVLPGGDRHGEHLEFLDWANRYEDGGMEVRSRHQQEAWLKELSCHVLRLEGDLPLEEKIRRIRQFMQNGNIERKNAFSKRN